MKTCTKCHLEKELSHFYTRSDIPGGYRKECKDCRKVAQKRYYTDSKKCREYRASERYEETQKKYRKSEKFRLYQQKYRNQKMKTDKNYKLARILRSRLFLAVKGSFKAGSAVKDLGCSIQELKNHIQSKFLPGINWGNWSYSGWHLDHIKPLASFDLTDRSQLQIACHYTNLQPLWAKDNLVKSDTLDHKWKKLNENEIYCTQCPTVLIVGLDDERLWQS